MAELWSHNCIHLLTLPRRIQKRRLPKSVRRLFNPLLQVIETVYSQLDDQINIESNYVHTSRDLCLRFYSKLTAHTLCIYFNRHWGVHGYLQAKKQAFPN